MAELVRGRFTAYGGFVFEQLGAPALTFIYQCLMTDSSWSPGPERRQEDSGTSKDVLWLGIEPRSQALAFCAITARPPQHDTTGPRHRAFDVFQGSCYNMYRRKKEEGAKMYIANDQHDSARKPLHKIDFTNETWENSKEKQVQNTNKN